MKSYFTDIVGNNALTRRLTKDIDEGILSHAYILEGPGGSGRHTLARSVIAALSCDQRKANKTLVPCKKCNNCLKILSGSSVDIHRIALEDDKTTIGVEAIRGLKNDMVTAPGDLDYKVYIISDADKMTLQAQNAFLLSLEEPPPYILFFLICENSANLLETVRSRAPILRMSLVKDEELEEYLLNNDKRAAALKEESPKDLKTVIFLSEGCIGRAVELLDAKARKAVFDKRDSVFALMEELSRKSKSEMFSSISTMGSKRPDVIAQMKILQSALRDLMVLKKCDSAELCFYEDLEYAGELSTHFTSPALMSLYEASRQAISDLEMNANVKLTLMSFMNSAGIF